MRVPMVFGAEDMGDIEELVYTHRRIKRGENLYRAGDDFHSLYTVRTGFFKTIQTLEDGRDQVTGFHMAGDLLGMDGIGSEAHDCDAIALEDSDVCVIPYSRLMELARTMHGLQHRFHKAMSQEIVRERGVMLLLGIMRAEERLAVFLLNLSKRFTERGYSPSQFVLRMTREEIGSYLGLKLETVSRAFSKFQSMGLISVQQKHISILDSPGLQRCVNPGLN
jgi:CRP/FNR family transcriptional regulator